MLYAHCELDFAKRFSRVNFLNKSRNRLGWDVARHDLLVVAGNRQSAIKRSLVAFFLLYANLNLELVSPTIYDFKLDKKLAQKRVVVPLPHVEAVELVFVFLLINVDVVSLLKLSRNATSLGFLPLHIISLFQPEVEVIAQLAIGQWQIVKASRVAIHIFAGKQIHLYCYIVDIFFIDFLSYVFEELSNNVLGWVVI